MRRVEALLRFIWDFVIGDDWRIAVGVVVALGLAAVISDQGVTAWWILPIAVAGLLLVSIWRALTRA